jgi:uncharacterized membrane-anchored protein YhcB (DUF1043 family)
MAKDGKKGEEVSLSELARRAQMNRATVREKLSGKGVRPRREKAKEKLYDLDEALSALREDGEPSLRKAQTAKTAAEAERAKLKLDRERGEVVSLQDARADLQEVLGKIYRHFAVTGPAALAPQLRGKSAAQVAAALKQDADRFFGELRAEHENYLRDEDEDHL